MKQVLVVVDEIDVTIPTIDFACYISRLTKCDLIGVLMSDKRRARALKKESLVNETSSTEGDKLFQFDIHEEKISKNRRLLSEACSNRGVSVQFVQEESFDIDSLIKESRYADLIIVDANISFEKRFEGTPTIFLRRLLEKTECPVIVSPETFDAIDEIIFGYDGGASAMFAIRQFTQLFPELRNKRLTVIEVCEGNDRLFTEKERLAGWLGKYYNDINYRLLYGSAKDELFGYLLGKERKLVIMGAFGRAMLSLLASKSSADLILKAINLPVFISHA